MDARGGAAGAAGLVPSLHAFDDVTLEDEATNMKTKYRLELSQTELTLYAADTRRSASGASALQMHLPLHAFARPECGGGGLLGQGLANPFWIRTQVNTGNGASMAAIKLTFAGRRADRDKVFEAISHPPAPPAAVSPMFSLEVQQPLAVLRSSGVLRDMNYPERQTSVAIELHAAELCMREADESSNDTARLDFRIPLDTVIDAVPTEHSAFMGIGKHFAIEIRHRLPALAATQPPARTRLDFPARPERDSLLAHLRSRRSIVTAARSSGHSSETETETGVAGARASSRRMSVSSCVPSTVRVMTTIKAGDFTVYVLECISADDGRTWQVQKRFSEFETLRKLLIQLDPKVAAISFPEKSLLPFSSTNSAKVAQRREDLQVWSSQIISLCSPHNAQTRSPLHAGGGHDYVASFFAPEDADLQTDSPRINRASVARMEKVALPSDTTDVEAAMMGMLRLLPNVSQELLLNYCGGAAKQGWMFKEGEHHAGWKRRWFILWPEESHPSFGRLLIYFETPDAQKAKGAIQILAPVVKAPKTPREEHFCIRLNAKKILDARDLNAMKTQDRKFILGTADEQSIKEWIELFRASGPAWKPREVEPDCCSWLMKKGTGAIGWWKKRWVELRGSQLIQWEGNAGFRVGASSHQGRWELENYLLHIPTAETRSRPNEFILMPKVEIDEEGAKVNPVFFSAETD